MSALGWYYVRVQESRVQHVQRSTVLRVRVVVQFSTSLSHLIREIAQGVEMLINQYWYITGYPFCIATTYTTFAPRLDCMPVFTLQYKKHNNVIPNCR